MNCAECREQLAALSEDLLAGAERRECLAHLEMCAGCRAEYEAVASLQKRLAVRGRAAAGAGLVGGVMRRIRKETQPERETIMSKILKHRWGFGLSAAAGTAALAVAAFIALSPKAFGVDQIIEAYSKVRTLHVKSFKAGAAQPNEYWIQCDNQGKAEKARYDLLGTEDGDKLITWTPEKTEIWFRTKHGFRIMQTSRIAPMMQGFLDTCQPQLVLKKLEADQTNGLVDVQTREPEGSETNALIIATHKDHSRLEIYAVDRATELVTRLDRFRLEGTNRVWESRLEFSDYNVPLDEKLFHLQDQLPPDVSVADQLNQLIGVPQGNLTDGQAAEETARQFFQALVDQDYKKAGLIYNGEQEVSAKAEFGAFQVKRIISVGPAEAQTNWVPRGYRVPCQLEVVNGAGGKEYVANPGPYVRPGDDEAHPDRWNITGGVDLAPGIAVLPDNAKYADMTPEETARAFFTACSRKDWDEAGKFMPYLNQRTEDYLGGLTIVSVGKSFGPDEYPGGLAAKGYPGRFVPYEIQLAPQEINVRVDNTNAAKRYVLTGVYDRQLKLQEDLKWTGSPEVLTNNDAYARMSPKEVVQACFDAQAKFDWTEMRKFTSEADVTNTQGQVKMAEKAGLDLHNLMPVFEVGEAKWSPEQSAWFVTCRVLQTKKWNLAVRNDNAAHRWQVDGGI
jgi:hypothetical protein